MSKKGLSMEEKKTKMLEIFHETKEFYTLKDLEKLAPKSKGIVVQSVKDVLDDLKGDGLVQFDKVGTSNYFWSFPSTAGATKQAQVDKLKQDLTAAESKVEELEAGYKEASFDREETHHRAALLALLSEQQSLQLKLKTELDAYGAADPVKVEEKRRAIEVAKEACVLWIDNASLLHKVIKENCTMTDQEINDAFELPTNWDTMTE